MDIENFGVIEDLYSDIKKEQEEQLESLKKKKCQIAEIDTYLDGILSKEQNDLGFSSKESGKFISRCDRTEQTEKRKACCRM